MSKVTVLGGGGWAIALAKVLYENGNDVTIWSAVKREIEGLKNDRENKISLPGIIIPDDIELTCDLDEAVKAGIDYAKDNDVKLIISLDCGIKAIEQVDYASSLGIDFIICDHHTTDETLPRAVAVLDSKRADDTYPYEHLSGCGVGFKFMQAFAIDNGIDFSRLEALLDFVAVSIASDIVPITGENRILAHFGIKRLNEHPSRGLKAIIETCGFKNARGNKNGQ